MTEPLRIGVVGTGALGQHHARILCDLDGADMRGVFDVDAARAREIAEKHGTVVAESLDVLLEQCEAIVVAAPTVAHADLAGRALSRGLHVLIEKPIASSLDEAEQILEAAGDRVVAVGHVEFYNPAVQALLNASGAPRFVEIDRLGVFSPRSLDVDVVLDLMIHDLQILQALDGTDVAEVRAVGIDVLTSKVDIANARIELASGCVANLTASRVSDRKVRRLRVFSGSAYYSVDYQEQSIKGFALADGDQGATASGRSIVQLDVPVVHQEPLRAELDAFVRACRGDDRAPLVSGRDGTEALKLAIDVVDAI